MNTPVSAGRLLSAALLTLAVITPSLRATKPAAAGNNSTAYSAQATAVRIEGARNTGPIVVGATGEVAVTGGALTASQAGVNYANGGFTADLADATAVGSGAEASAEARVNKFHVEVIMWTGNTIIEADYIEASVAASTNPGGKTTLESRVNIQNLTVNGQRITVTGAANQQVVLANDTRLIINEQTSSSVKGSADIDLVALHFWACDIEGRVGIVSSGITVNGKPAQEEHHCGKLTGGGWITGTPSGAKGTFGVSGGIRRGEFWGHLNYIDHGTGMKVQSTAVTGFDLDPQSANGRIITYAVKINGVAGTARVRAVDNGEPGRSDIFDITLSTGYRAAGDLGGARPGGGNIQLHKCPPGWE